MKIKIIQDIIDILRFKKLCTEENGYKVINLFGFKFRKKIDLIKYWEQRADKYKERAVGDSWKTEKESIEGVRQKEKLFSYVLEKSNVSNINITVDFGCGVGRFENFLLKLSGQKVYALDVTKKLLELAPSYDKVEYIHLADPIKIPLENNTADFVFINSVLGGIIDDNVLENTLRELVRISAENSTFLICENNKKTTVAHWCGRDILEYKKILEQAVSSFQGGGNFLSTFSINLLKVILS